MSGNVNYDKFVRPWTKLFCDTLSYSSYTRNLKVPEIKVPISSLQSEPDISTGDISIVETERDHIDRPNCSVHDSGRNRLASTTIHSTKNIARALHIYVQPRGNNSTFQT